LKQAFIGAVLSTIRYKMKQAASFPTSFLVKALTKLQVSILVLATLFVPRAVNAQACATPLANKPGSIHRVMIVDPSSTRVSLGKVSLIVSPLTHNGKVYIGEYQIKVMPYFLKNEKGTLELEASDDSMREFMGGSPIKFIGKATNSKKSKPKIIIGKATPSTNDRGTVTFSIVTDNGLMVFNTSYHFGD